ncbi:AsmA family protein [Photobacterium aphoticum]|uniref:AsmA family protein n=1 Tax=Photobacterium aphoticum TaxID=754436 RepID=A0A090QX69_9GAMM|nr:AsmA family protein [Photobacterium aphoticum]
MQWQDITLHNVLIDGEHHNQTWLLHGLSAQWQHTRLNGQAIYDHQRHHVTVAQLTLSDGQWQTTTPLAQLQHDALARIPRDLTATIERLDILNTSMETADFTLNQASLSLENWQWPQAVNTQPDALLSFSADSGRWHDTAFTDPLLDLAFSPNTITLQGAAVSVMEGYVQAAGSLTSHQWMLDNLSINGIKWLLPADWRTSLPALMAPLQQATQAPSLRIKQLAIRHTSLTDSNAEWPWQISGLNLDGHDLTLMENGQWGLWHGELTSGAQLVSLNTVEMQAPW